MKKRIEIAANESNDAFERGFLVGVILTVGGILFIELGLRTLFGG